MPTSDNGLEQAISNARAALMEFIELTEPNPEDEST